MGVTIDGVKGYEYQYKVTLMLALLFKADKIILFVESEGSEDAKLILESKGVKINIEIQVKRENYPIEIATITKWLSHFKERKSNSNLLSNLMENDQTMALFITHSRCSDNTVQFKTALEKINSNRSLSLSKKWFEEFQKILQNQNLGKTKLMKNRELFCKNQGNIIKTKDDLNIALKNCLILEEFTDENVDNFIKYTLNTNYNIAQSTVDSNYLQLLEIIKNGRDNGTDVYQMIMDCIESFAIGKPIIDSYYKTRSEEPDLIEKLTANGFLLLTGSSQCGKTELAKTLSNNFVKKGYDYQIHDDVSELKRFLNSNISDNKIAILQDPFGHISLKENHSNILRAIKDLLSNKEKHHHIIISSRLEILYNLFDTENIKDCKIKNIDWCDLTIKSNKTIYTFWKNLCVENFVPEEIGDTIAKGILETDSNNLLQIGQLVYLINEDFKSLLDKNFSDLEHIARRDSKEIAENLKSFNELSADILSYISVCSNTIHKVLLKDLAYILSDYTDLLSIIRKDIFSSSFGKDNSPIFPEYPSGLHLSDDVVNAINYLEERGFIYLAEDYVIVTHPNYYEAGRYLFFEKGTAKQKKKLNIYEKIIGCINSMTAYQASKNYTFIHSKIKNSLKDNILDIAFVGLNSIFPSVEDTSTIFLMNQFDNLSEERYSELIHKIQNGGTSDSYIFWNNNIPFISTKGFHSRNFYENNELIIKKVEEQLSNKILPELHDAWTYLILFKNEEEKSFDNFLLLLQYNEAFVRSKVTYAFFKSNKIVDPVNVSKFFDDEHPTVVFSAIRASLLNWFSYSEEIKKAILKLSVESLNKKEIAIRAFNLLSNFSIHYASDSVYKDDFNKDQKNKFWQIWGKLFPICVENVPIGMQFNSARFGSTMDTALKYLDLQTGIEVLNSWYKRIDYQIKNGEILDEYEMAISDNLMILTEKNYKIRQNIFSKLINYEDTSFVLSNLKWIIEYWSNLHISEKKTIKALITSDRKDIRWIHAVVLNSYSSPPAELCQIILGINELDESKLDYTLKIFPERLLEDCLNVFCGFPQPLWWLAVHHHNKDFWQGIIKQILQDENNVGFNICLQQFLHSGVNGFNAEWQEWEEIWSSLCKNVVDKNSLTKVLIYNTARCSCNLHYAKKLWSILINSYISIGEKDNIIGFIVNNLELLQQTGHPEDLFKILESTFILEVIEKLPLDYFIFNLLKMSKFEQKENLEELLNLLKDHDIRIFGTFNYIENKIGNNEISENLISTLKSCENLIYSKGKNDLNELKHIKEYKLDDWIGIN